MDLAKAKSILMKQEGGTSLYEHLVELMLKIVVEQPDNALANLEALSASVRAKTFPDFAGGGGTGGAAASEELVSARAALLSAQLAVFKAPVADEEGAGGPGEPVQDLTGDAALLEWGGVGLGRTEAFRTHLALKHLAAKFPAKGLRWWGRLFGRGGDYTVAEGVMDAGEEEGDDDKDALGNAIQKTGDGPNKFTYFVCVGFGAPWTKLPRVTPHQLTATRALRRYLTGDLAAPVAGHPPFPGNEANLLRATIALISADTQLAIAGSLTAVEGDENGAVEPNAEEWEAPDLSGADGWVHAALEINALGRTRPNPPVMDAEGNEVPVEGAPEPSAPLKGVGEDPPVDEAAPEGGGAWLFSAAPVSGLAEGEAPTGPFVAKSLRWPGAVMVGLGKKCAGAYVGWGLPVSTAPYQPTLPAAPPAVFDFAAEETRVAEQKDVTVDPTPPPVEGEGGEAAEE
jgi:radial spoke head protein 4A